MARFHAYSFGNILAIARQRPTVTRVAGFHTWKEMGRFVKRGEKGIQILAPMVGHRRRRDDADRNRAHDDNAKPAPVLIGFRASTFSKDYLVICGRDFTRSIGTAK